MELPAKSHIENFFQFSYFTELFDLVSVGYDDINEMIFKHQRAKIKNDQFLKLKLWMLERLGYRALYLPQKLLYYFINSKSLLLLLLLHYSWLHW